MASYKPRAVMSVALATVLGAGAADADVTAEQVWADWKTYMAASGYTLSGTETQNGDALEVTEIVMVTEVPDEDVSIQITMSEVTLTSNGDGTVSIGFPATVPMGVKIDSENDPVDIQITYSTTDWSGVVSGDPDAMSYAYSASEIGMTVDQVTFDQVTFPMSHIGAAEVTFADFTGSSQSTVGALYETIQTISSGPIKYILDVTDPEGSDGTFVMKGGAAGMNSSAKAAFPADGDINDMAAMLDQGFAVDASLNITGGSLDLDFDDEGEVYQIDTSSDSNELGITMNADGLAYSLASTAQKIFLAGTEFPLPIEISAQENAFNLQIPLTARDEVQPMALSVTLGDFVMSDLIWGLVDPTGQLPRDPATVSVALAGTAKLLVDLLAPAAMEQLDSGNVQPGELHSLDVTGLTVRAAGAELLGDGAFTFDNSDLTTFDGMPAPSGKLNLSLSGGNGLLDKLVGMGLIPDQEASGVRMMMGLFAVPGSAPDTLNSTIEVKGNGQIFANGQRIQ